MIDIVLPHTDRPNRVWRVYRTTFGELRAEAERRLGATRDRKQSRRRAPTDDARERESRARPKSPSCGD